MAERAKRIRHGNEQFTHHGSTPITSFNAEGDSPTERRTLNEPLASRTTVPMPSIESIPR